MTYHGDPPGNNVASNAYSPGPYPPSFGNQPPLNHLPPNQSRNHAGRRSLSVGTVVLLVILTLVSAGIGATVGVMAGRHSATDELQQVAEASGEQPSAEQIDEATIRLCTAYAAANAALPEPQDTALDVYPVVNAIRWALAENPNAQPEVREAIEDLVAQFDGQLTRFGDIRARGYAQPPNWTVETMQAAGQRAWEACRLDE